LLIALVTLAVTGAFSHYVVDDELLDALGTWTLRVSGDRFALGALGKA
jgi:hypothetical protein